MFETDSLTKVRKVHFRLPVDQLSASLIAALARRGFRMVGPGDARLDDPVYPLFEVEKGKTSASDTATRRRRQETREVVLGFLVVKDYEITRLCTVSVKKSLAREEMLRMGGFVTEGLPANFMEGQGLSTGSFEVSVARFSESFKLSYAAEELEKLGYRGVSTSELLGLCLFQPNILHTRTLIGQGDLLGDQCLVANMTGGDIPTLCTLPSHTLSNSNYTYPAIKMGKK